MVPFRYSVVVKVFITALECREAIQIQLNYQRAHHRLANLYLRLGEEEKTLFHFKKAGAEADPGAIAKAKLLLSLLNKCEQAKRIRDWNIVISDSTTTLITPVKVMELKDFLCSLVYKS